MQCIRFLQRKLPNKPTNSHRLHGAHGGEIVSSLSPPAHPPYPQTLPTHPVPQIADVDTPLLRAGLMATLHSIVDSPSAPLRGESRGSILAFPDVAVTAAGGHQAKRLSMLRSGGILAPTGAAASGTGRTASNGRHALAGPSPRKQPLVDIQNEPDTDRIIAVIVVCTVDLCK